VDNRYIELVRERDSLRLLATQGQLTPAQAQQLQDVTRTFLDYRTAAEARAHARVDTVRAIVASYSDRAAMFLGGASMITADMIDFIRSDLVVFGAAILLLIVLLMGVIFREWRFVILPLLTCVISVAMMLGLLGWVDWRLTVISSNFVALQLIINLALTIHLTVCYRENHALHPDWDRAQLVIKTVTYMARPCLYTVLTTMVAFASLVVSGIRPVIDFGWIMTIGLALSLLLSFVLMPALLLLWPQGEPRETVDNSAVLTLRFSRFTERFGWVVSSVSLLAVVAAIWGMSRLEVENRFIDYFHESTEIYQGMSVIDKYLGGTISLDIILTDTAPAPAAPPLADDPFADADDPFASADEPFAEDADPFAEDADPFAGESDAVPAAPASYWFTLAGLQEVERVHDYLESLPEVGKVQSLATLYKVARDINGAQLNDFELALMKKSVTPAINAVLVDPYLSADQTRITLRIMETNPELKRMELVEKIRTFLLTEGGFEPEQVRFSGLLVLYNNMLQSLFTSQIVSLGAVFLGIMLMFLVLFRSLTLALIAILPNLLAAGVVLGGMGLAGVPLDMMTITIASITVGIGVDDTIHYIHRFRDEFPKDRNYLATMHRSHSSIGRAMFYTSVVIIAGFSVLALSQFIPSVYFGLLTAFAMATAILAALTLLPKLILLLKPFGAEAV
jgi:predicted RND superfamily exporter protein